MILKIHINYKYVTSGHGQQILHFNVHQSSTQLYKFCYFSEMLTCALKTHVNEYNMDIFFENCAFNDTC